jgi:lipoprotein-releasing system ATP-binding protein
MVDGVDFNRLNDKKLADFRNKKIGFVFQFHHLLPEFTALENICIPAYIAGKSKREAENKANELLEFLNLNDRSSHKPSELSGGEQQRVAVARALINSPAVLMADEPSGNLDSENSRQLHQLFFDLRASFHQTIVIVTHNEELAALSDRRLFMQDGLISISKI